MFDFKVIIIGGGASGLFCAMELLNDSTHLLGKEVLVLEGNDRVAKKLIATGNGQGNLSNKNISESNYYGEKVFVSNFIFNEKQINLKNYLYKKGIPLTCASDGKMYPISKQANAVSDIIRADLSEKNCTILTGKKVTKIVKTEQGFSVLCNGEKFSTQYVVFAVGGNVGKQFGTDGSSYSIVEELGHTKTKLYPSLVQIKTQTDKIRGLKGLKEVAKVSAYDGEILLKSAVGDLLFTEYGLSGSAIFQISGLLANAKNPKVKIEFVPELTSQELLNILNDRKNLSCFNGTDMLLGVLNKRVGQAVCKSAKNLSVESVVEATKNFWLSVTGNLGNNYAQVTKGGINTSEINPKTYESKLVNNLYFAGEVIDIDGDCGGYNLTFAFVSGIMVARSIKDKIFS